MAPQWLGAKRTISNTQLSAPQIDSIATNTTIHSTRGGDEDSSGSNLGPSGLRLLPGMGSQAAFDARLAQ